MALLDLLGRRLREGPLTARALRAACDDASPAVLNERLKSLREAGLVEHRPEAGYALTATGEELRDAFAPLYRFAERWAERP